MRLGISSSSEATPLAAILKMSMFLYFLFDCVRQALVSRISLNSRRPSSPNAVSSHVFSCARAEESQHFAVFSFCSA